MNTRDYRRMRDRMMGTDRKYLYGSDRAHFPFPHKLSRKIKTKFGFDSKGVR